MVVDQIHSPSASVRENAAGPVQHLTASVNGTSVSLSKVDQPTPITETSLISAHQDASDAKHLQSTLLPCPHEPTAPGGVTAVKMEAPSPSIPSGPVRKEPCSSIAPPGQNGLTSAQLSQVASDIPVRSTAGIPLDPALDEDAPHDVDDEDGLGGDSPSSPTSLQAGLDPIDSSYDVRSFSAPISERPAIKQEESAAPPVQPAQSTPASKGAKRKRHSDETGSRAPRRKSSPRVKPPEQLAAEALIEKMNPTATKNELRSLKLRALHATRIAEREKGMSPQEIARRLRLREYVRRKRSEERMLKASGQLDTPRGSQNPGNAGDQSVSFSVDMDASFNSANTSSVEPKGFLSEPSDQKVLPLTEMSSGQLTHEAAHQSIEHSVPIQSLPNSSEPNQSGGEVLPRTVSQINCSANAINWQDPRLQPSPFGHSVFPTPTVDQEPNTKRPRCSLTGGRGSEKTPRRKSSSRVKTPEQTSLEARIEQENPHATKNQLKSLKLRALHACRIAEREQNMSEKEKARRLKLREYMRKRRDVERTERGDPPLDPNSTLNNLTMNTMNVRPQPESVPLLESGREMHPQVSSMANNDISTELNAADRLAAFSIMGLNNNFQHHYPHPPQDVQQQPQSDNDLHLHPLFQMPMAQSSVDAVHTYTPPIHQNYAIAGTWPSIPPSHHHVGNGLSVEDDAQKALHAALEEAIYMKHHQETSLDDRLRQERGVMDGVKEAIVNNDSERLVRLEEERIRVAEEEILGVERARIADAEMALIAAAAAEVERAHLVGAVTPNVM